MEESYTQDATLAEDREQALRRQLRLAEDALLSGTAETGQLRAAVTSVRSELRAELDATRLERDGALGRLRTTEAELAEQARSVANLQAVLDNFQQVQAAESADERAKLQQDLRRLLADRDRLELRCGQLQADIDAQSALVDAARRLAQQIELKDDQLAQQQAAREFPLSAPRR